MRKRTDWRGTALVTGESQAPSPLHIVCVIQPCPQGSHWTSWQCDSKLAGMGMLAGRFVQNGQACLSLWESVDGVYTGSDWLAPVQSGRCVSHGAVLRGGIPQWRWELELTRLTQRPLSDARPVLPERPPR